MSRFSSWETEYPDEDYEDGLPYDMYEAFPPERESWEEQAEFIERRRSPKCKQQYNRAADLLVEHRRGGRKFHCEDVEALQEAVHAAFVGDCEEAQRLTRAAGCPRKKRPRR